jgi:hypothetical protein
MPPHVEDLVPVVNNNLFPRTQTVNADTVVARFAQLCKCFGPGALSDSLVRNVANANVRHEDHAAVVRFGVRIFGADGKVDATASNSRTPAVEAASAKDSLGCLQARLVVADDSRSKEAVAPVRYRHERDGGENSEISRNKQIIAPYD